MKNHPHTDTRAENRQPIRIRDECIRKQPSQHWQASHRCKLHPEITSSPDSIVAGIGFLNKALDEVARTRMGHDEEMKKYVETRTAEGLNPKEIKRYIACSFYRTLEVPMG